MADTGMARATLLADFDELLKRPADATSRLASAKPRAALRLLAGALVAYAVYGAVAGLFQGGGQTALAAMKAPMIVLFSLILCAPSLYVFTALADADMSGRRLLAALAGFGAMLAVLFVGFLPIAWLFSVSSRSLGFMVWLHLAIWIASVGFAKRILNRVLAEHSPQGLVALWLILLCMVSFQVTTMVRPVLWRGPDRPWVERERLFFLEQFGRILDPPRTSHGAKPGARSSDCRAATASNP